MVDDNTLFHIAERFGTPTYVYDLEAIRRRIATLRGVLPDADLRYAVKANPCGTVLRAVAGAGVGAEVITAGELERALRAGIPPERLLLGGPGQDRDLITRAVEIDIGLVSLDSASQWELWRDRPIRSTRFLVRVNPGLDPRTHDHLATGAASSKFGLPRAEATELATDVAKVGLLAGFHVHAGSQISSLDVYDEIFALLIDLYAGFSDLALLNIGGGFAVPCFPFSGFAERVVAFAERFGLRIVIEPGRSLVAEAGVLLTRVIHIKEGERRHLIADAGMADLLRPALYGASHPIRLLGGGRGEPRAQDLDGPLCENADRLGQDVLLPVVDRGDLLVVGEAGAYGYAMASNYASNLRPAEVVVDGPSIALARRREKPEDLWRLEGG